MGRDPSGKAVAFYDPLEPLPLRDADDVDVLGRVEDVAEDLVARGERVPFFTSDLADGPGGGTPAFSKCPRAAFVRRRGDGRGPTSPSWTAS